MLACVILWFVICLWFGLVCSGCGMLALLWFGLLSYACWLDLFGCVVRVLLWLVVGDLFAWFGLLFGLFVSCDSWCAVIR